ncbi:MAG: T9SS type A sorting domain-containing protein [Candidatus Kapaibacterium sp.]
MTEDPGFFSALIQVLVTKQGVYSIEGIFDYAQKVWNPPAEIIGAWMKKTQRWTRDGNTIETLLIYTSDGTMHELEFTSSTPIKNFPTVTLKSDKIIPSAPTSGGVSIMAGDDLYAVSGNQVFVTHDEKTWQIDTSGLGSAYPSAMITDSSQNVYLATYTGIFHQGLNESTWHLLSGSPKGATFMFVTKKDMLFAATYNLLYESINRGLTWTLDTLGIDQSQVKGMGDDTLGNLFMINSNYKGEHVWTQTVGHTWHEVGQALANISADPTISYLKGISADSLEVHVGTAFGEFDSFDGGKTWQPLTKGYAANNIYYFYRFPGSNSIMTTNLGLFAKKATDTAWTKTFPQNTYLAKIPFFLDNAGRMYAPGAAKIVGGYSTGPNLMFISTDQGMTWAADTLGLSKFSGGVQFVDENGNEYFATNNSPHMRLFSKAQSGTWQGDSTGYAPSMGDAPSKYISDHHGNIYLAFGNNTSGRMLKRSITGSAWTEVTLDPLIKLPYAFAVTKDGKLVGGNNNTSVGYYDGSSWKVIQNPPGLNNPSGYPESVDSSNGLYVIYGNVDANSYYTAYGVYYTKDLGKHWQKITDGSINFGSIVSFKDSTYGLSDNGVYNITSGLSQSVLFKARTETPLPYPNPVHRGERLHYAPNENISATLTDLLGRVITTSDLNNGSFVVPMNISPGIYFIEQSGKRNEIVVME